MRPNFLIIGAAKAGTTSLHHYLRQHPQVFLPASMKESFYFCRNAELGGATGYNYGGSRITHWRDYERLFEGSNAASATGEACVAYLRFFRESIPEIKARLGDPKIIIVLRNPVERAFSNYLHHVKDGQEPLSFERALEEGKDRCDHGYWWGYDLISPGMYYAQVEAYMAAFPETFVFLHEDLATDTAKTMREIFGLLGVDPEVAIDVSLRHNVSSVRMRGRRALRILDDRGPVMRAARFLTPTGAWPAVQERLHALRLVKPKMRTRTQNRLRRIFADDIDRLESLIGRPLHQWRTNA